MNRSHASRQTRTVAGYFLPQVEPSKISSSRAAASTVAACRSAAAWPRQLCVVIGDEPHRGPDQVHHAGLDHRVRPGCLDRLREPVSPSQQAINTSCMPRLRSSANTPAQNFAPSAVCTRSPAHV